MGGRATTVEKICAALAHRSHGIVTRAELLAAGVTAREVERRQQSGYLIGEFPGVYRVGHRAPSIEARYMAAVKACGEGAALSDRAAAYLYGLVKGSPPIPHVAAPGKRRVRGVITKRSCEIERTMHRGIPITAVARTLVDLAATLSVADLARACHEAGVKYATTPRQEEVLARRPTARGAGKLREVMSGKIRVTQSRLERRFLELLAERDLPLPDETNKPAGTFRVDCRWNEPPLTVELDSYRFHNSRYSWEQDHRREREARAREDDYRRYTYGDVYENPHAMLRELRSILSERGN